MEHFTAEVQRIRPAAPGQQVIELAADEWLARIIRNRNVRYVAIGIEDGRRITPLQQRKAYATLRDIGEYTGYPMDAIKGIMKVEHMMRTGDYEYFFPGGLFRDESKRIYQYIVGICPERGDYHG